MSIPAAAPEVLTYLSIGKGRYLSVCKSEELCEGQEPGLATETGMTFVDCSSHAV